MMMMTVRAWRYGTHAHTLNPAPGPSCYACTCVRLLHKNRTTVVYATRRTTYANRLSYKIKRAAQFFFDHRVRFFFFFFLHFSHEIDDVDSENAIKKKFGHRSPVIGACTFDLVTQPII